jgi:hypothetical protein
MERLSRTGSRWSLLSFQGSGDAQQLMVAVDGAPRLDTEITREILVLDATTLGLIRHQMYTGTRCVVSNTFQQFRWNPSIPGGSFKL